VFRKPARKPDSNAFKNVGILRELYIEIQIQAIRDDQSMREAVNTALCQHLGRLDLIEKHLDPRASATASAR
jgi:hypothetical protein